jgi:peptide deformylase
MSILNILEYPDKRLRTVATPITDFNDKLQTLIDDMFETMYAAPGVGLAASQVDVHKRMMVIDVSEDKTEPLVFINPEIVEKHDEALNQEGCLSVPDFYADVMRADRIKVKAKDRNGKDFEMEADELLGVCIQHELDHLNGIMFVDYLSRLKQDRIKKKLAKRNK